MRIFTLGKNGIPLFFFALFLFSGTYSSYGQACPTVDSEDSTQYFCDSQEAVVGDLSVTTGTDVVWYADQTSSTPLGSTTILANGTYYAGTSANNCQNNRAEVAVVIARQPEILGIKASTTPTGAAQRKQSLAVIGVCVADVNNPGLTVGDLRTNVEDEENVRWYLSRTSENALDPSTPLVNNTDYFAAAFFPEGNCETSRRKTTVRFFSEPAPTGLAVQKFCPADNPTLADIDASGNNRYFNSADSQTELGEDTPLVDGRTYYISAVGENCESTERLAVTVELIDADAGEDNIGNVLCVSEAEGYFDNVANARNYFVSLLETGVPTDGSFSEETLAAIVADFNDGTQTGTFETSYTATFEEGCQDTVVLGVRVEADPNAGEDTELSVCISEILPLIPLAEANLPMAEAAFREFLNGTDIDPTGTFEPSLESVLNELKMDIAEDNFPQTYEIDYVVNNNGCESRATLEITVAPEVNAGTTNSAELCHTEVEEQGIFASETSLRSYFLDLIGAEDIDGTFNPALSTLVANYNNGINSPSEPFETQYTVDNNVCDASTATATLTVTAAVPGEAGTISVPDLCSTEGEINLFDYLGGTSNTGGTFTSDEATVTGGVFNASAEGPGTFNITYTVSVEDETTCLSSSDTTQFTITVDQAPDAGSNNSETLCETAVVQQGIFDDEASLKSYFIDLLGAEDTNGTFNPALSTLVANFENGIDGQESFEVTYTVDNNDACEAAMATVSLTINEAIEAVAGTPQEDITYCSNDTAVTLADLLSGANPDGIFTSDDADVSGGTFNPVTEGAGSYEITYTVSPETACVTNTATVTFTIEVNEAPNAGPGGDFTFCQSEFAAIVAQITANPEGEGIELLEELDASITTGGDFSDSTLAELMTEYAETTSFPATFTTTYTVSNENCTDSAEYSITVNPNEEANAGGPQEAIFCSNAGIIDLFTTLGDDALSGGTFTSEELDIIDGFKVDVTGLEVDTYEVQYTVSSETNPCVIGSNSATITIIIDDIFELEETASTTVCTNDIDEDFFTTENLEETFLGLLPAAAPQDGTFEPSLTELVADYEGGMTTGNFETTYTITAGECQESIDLSITVRENAEAELTEVSDPDPVCQSEDVIDLYNLIGDNSDAGVFEDYEEGTFNPRSMEPGTYDITYTLSEETAECIDGTASITFTITVLDSALAGEPDELTFCTNEGVQDLYGFLSANADADGSFTMDGEEVTDGAIDPEVLGAGTYEVIYTVPAENDCGEDTSIFEITILDSPAAPTVAPFDGCLADGATVTDLDITVEDGNSFTVYTDAELQTPVADTEELISGTYYVAQANPSGCESEAAEITVTLADSDAPTISLDGDTFCTSDGATLAELEERVSANGEITWYATATGTESLPVSTVLQNGTTYYATSTSADSACESSERLAVTITLETCEIVIPEAFSPNGDQKNDYFTIQRISSEFPNHNLEIYNRWGEMVYNGKGANPGWDGTSSEGSFGSGVLPVGVYFYILYFNDGQTAPTQGRVYLSR